VLIFARKPEHLGDFADYAHYDEVKTHFASGDEEIFSGNNFWIFRTFSFGKTLPKRSSGS
jgi:hypothetical protein